MRRILSMLLVYAASLIATSESASGAIITIDYDTTLTTAFDSNVGHNNSNASWTALDGVNHIGSVTWGTSSGTTVTNYSAGANQAVLSTSVSHVRDGQNGNYVQTVINTRFTANEANLEYLITGNYSNLGSLGTTPRTDFRAFLYDETAGNTILFQNLQISHDTISESFQLGGAGGDTYNETLGSLTGSLFANHTYFWVWEFTTQSYPDADAGATGSGSMTLTINSTSATAVPEPSSLLILGLVASGLTMLSRRQERGRMPVNRRVAETGSNLPRSDWRRPSPRAESTASNPACLPLLGNFIPCR